MFKGKKVNSGHNILELYNNLVMARFAISKMKRDM